MDSSRYKIHSLFAEFLSAVRQGHWQAAHELMSEDYRQQQSIDSTTVFGSEIAGLSLAEPEAWLVSSSVDGQAYVLPFDLAGDLEEPPAAYGLQLENGEWKVTGEIVEGIWDEHDIQAGGFKTLA